MVILFLLSFLIVFPAFAADSIPLPPGGRPISLSEAFALTKKQSEILAIRKETIAEALALTRQIAARIKPHVSLYGEEFVQDSSDESTTGVANTFNRRDIPEARIQASQPLFHGWREFLAFRAAKHVTRGYELQLRRAEELLYQDVAQAYLNLSNAQEEIRIRETILRTHQDRLKELKQRERIGRSRKSEVLAEETQLAILEADLTQAKSDEQVFQEALKFLTGLHENLRPLFLPLPPLPPIDLARQLYQSRSDVEAAREELASQDLRVSVEKRGYWPTIDLNGNYYLYRVGFQEKIKWDVTVAGSLPLYTGGEQKALIQQAEARRGSAAQSLYIAKRRAAMEIETAYKQLTSSLMIVHTLDRAVLLSNANIQAQGQDYRYGLVTNLDVLTTLNVHQDTALKLSNARHQATLYSVQLEVATGGSPK